MRYAKWAAGLLLTGLLLAFPEAAARGAAQAMAQWYATVVPSLFPFLVLMPLLTGGEAAEIYERLLGRGMARLFGLPGATAPAIMIGMIAGTPAGAVAARDAAARSGMNRGQLHRMALAVMGFSPAFLVGGVGAAMLGDPRTGWRLLAAQAFAQLILLLSLRRAWRNRTQPVVAGRRAAEDSPVRNAVRILLTICGYMAAFGCLAGVLRAVAGEGPADALLCLLDVPSGVALVAGAPIGMNEKLVALAAMCGFGGLCVIAQCLGALRTCGVSLWECLGLRFAAAGISAACMALMLRLPDPCTMAWTARLRLDPMPLAGLAAALLSVPVLFKLRKSIS